MGLYNLKNPSEIIFRTMWKGDMKRHLQTHHPVEVDRCRGDVEKVPSETYMVDEDVQPFSSPPSQPAPGESLLSSPRHAQTSDEFCAAAMTVDPVTNKPFTGRITT